MQNQIISLHISNDLDIVLAHRYAEQLAEVLHLSLSDHTRLATAVSEVCRNCLEYVGEGKLSYDLAEINNRRYLLATVSDFGAGIPQKELDNVLSGKPLHKGGRGVGLLNSRKLTDYFDISSCNEGTCVKLGKLIHKKKPGLTEYSVDELRKQILENEPASPYEEIKRRNNQLLHLTDELRQKNIDAENQLAEIKRLNEQLIAAQKREQENNQSFSFITDNIQHAIWKTNSSGKIESINKYWQNYTGHSLEDTLTIVESGVIHKDDLVQARENWKKGVESGRPFEFLARVKRFDDVYHWFLSRAKPITDKNGDLQLWIGISMDIDEQKRSAEELEKLVSERTYELIKTNEELSRSNQDLEQFAYVASHDLKEPIRMVSNFTKLLARRYKDKLDDEGDEFIGFISEGAERMQYLVNDLLAYSRVGRHDTNKSIVDVEEVLNDVLENLHEKIEVQGAQIEFSNMPKLPAVRSMLIQLFQNLIENAIKFRSQSSPHISITAKMLNKRWQFSVSDNGIGIPKEFFEKIFVIFQRLHTRDKYPGTGMGLAICKKIVEYHGGTIWLESEAGKGTTFHFSLPA